MTQPTRHPGRRAAKALLATAALLVAGTGLARAAGPTQPTARTALAASPVTAKTAQPATGRAGAQTISGPIAGGTHGYPLTASSVDLRSHGYAEQEFFFSGTAHSFTSQQPLTSDGRWQVQEASAAPFKSRLLVRAPTDPRRFNGTVVVEWLNVSAGRDIDVDWDYGYSELLNAGFAYVGVTAQAVGLNALTRWDPARYSTLAITSDDFSYDIFSQAGAALRSDRGRTLLPGLRVRDLIADGESQSAGRMTTYVDAVAPVAKVYDGYLIHSNGATGAALSGTLRPPTPTLLRTDLARPVLNLETETDVLAHLPARQADDRNHRLWEATGTAHVDNDDLTLFGYQNHRQNPQDVDPSCTSPANTAPEKYLFDTAYTGLRTWVRTGRQLPIAPRMEINAAGTDVARDALGNGVGGLRLPQLSVPVATLTGTGNRAADTNPVSGFCRLFGTTVPFDSATLARLYPTHAAYVRAFTAATTRLVAQGFLLRADADDALFAAAQAPVPSPRN